MTEISFYQLTRTPLEKALPSLLEKILQQGKRAVLRGVTEARVSQINDALWTFSTLRFIPHGMKGDGFESRQPIYLTTEEENPNKAEMLVLVEGADAPSLSGYVRVLDVFDGNNEEELTAARSRWKKRQSESGNTLTYWKQNAEGAWEKGAA